MNRLKMSHVVLALLVLVIATVGSAVTAQAAVIGPGFDLLHTPPGGGLVVIPMGPTVPLEGNPFGPGDTDTIVERTTGLADGATGTIDVELVALSLTSVDPVDLGGGSFFDIFVVLDPNNRSFGEINVLTHGPDGGLFDSFFDVFVQIDLVPLNPTGTAIRIFDNDRIASSNTPWSHTPTPGYPNDPQFPAGNFYITEAGIQHSGPHPFTVPAAEIPEPSSLIVFGLLGVAFTGGAWRRRRNNRAA